MNQLMEKLATATANNLKFYFRFLKVGGKSSGVPQIINNKMPAKHDNKIPTTIPPAQNPLTIITTGNVEQKMRPIIFLGSFMLGKSSSQAGRRGVNLGMLYVSINAWLLPAIRPIRR
jgi:hypothetical protein